MNLWSPPTGVNRDSISRILRKVRYRWRNEKMMWIPEKLFQLSLTTMEYNGRSEKSCSRRAEQVIVSVLPAILSKGRNWCSWQIAVLVFGSLLHFFLPWHVVSSSTVYRGETGHHQLLSQPPPTSSPWLLLHLSASVGRRSPDLTDVGGVLLYLHQHLKSHQLQFGT